MPNLEIAPKDLKLCWHCFCIVKIKCNSCPHCGCKKFIEDEDDTLDERIIGENE